MAEGSICPRSNIRGFAQFVVLIKASRYAFGSQPALC